MSITAIKRSGLLICLMALSACSSLQYQPEPEQSLVHYAWPEVRQRLEERSSWELIGKIGIRTEEESLTAAINRWMQVDDFFQIDISSTFLGIGASRLSGNAHNVVLEESGEEPIASDSPDRLIYEALGIPLPVTYLPHWIKGLPLPDAPYTLELSPNGLPKTLEQLNWKLEFSKYEEYDSLPLPGKIRLTGNNVRIIMAIKEWTLI